jgi:hypothetical protein
MTNGLTNERKTTGANSRFAKAGGVRASMTVKC